MKPIRKRLEEARRDTGNSGWPFGSGFTPI